MYVTNPCNFAIYVLRITCPSESCWVACMFFSLMWPDLMDIMVCNISFPGEFYVRCLYAASKNTPTQNRVWPHKTTHSLSSTVAHVTQLRVLYINQLLQVMFKQKSTFDTSKLPLDTSIDILYRPSITGFETYHIRSLHTAYNINVVR